MQAFLKSGLKIILSLLMFVFLTNGAYASKLPDDLWIYIKEQFPDATQRFDSVVVVSKDVMYIPLYPAQSPAVSDIEVEYTYPKGQKLSQKPEVVIFNNNFVLLKLFKDESGSYSITTYEDVPMKVKLGIMPQDMLVPPGLKIPDNLKLILGDLVVPTKDEGSLVFLKEKTKAPEILLKNELVPLNQLKNKKTYITTANSKFMYVFDETSKSPLYQLKLNGLPSKIIPSVDSKMALVLYFASKNIEIVDLKNERTVTQIPLDENAKDVVLDKNTNMAYVSSQGAKTIYCVDLNSAKLAKAIKLEQSPSKVAISKDGSFLAFTDGLSGELFNLKLGDDAQVNPVAKTKNISKIICDDARIYAISRTQNKMFVYDKTTLQLVDEENLNEKPLDAVFYDNKIYILCAKEGVMDIYDCVTRRIMLSTQLDENGFYSKITQVPNQHNVLITGLNNKSFILFDLDKMEIVTKQTAQIDVANVLIIEKTSAQDL